MNTNTLRKAIEELSKTAPDISYVRGMLETLVEVSEGANQTRDIPLSGLGHINSMVPNFPPTGKTVTADSPEGMAVEAALASLGGPRPNLNSLTLEKNVTLNPHV